MLSGTVSVIPTGGSTSVVEGGAADSYTIALDTMPSGPVEIILDSSLDQVQLSIDGGATFGFFQSVTLNDTTPMTVLVQGYEDGIVEGPHNDTIVSFLLNSADPVNYPFSTVIPTLNVTVQDSPSEMSASVQEVFVNSHQQNRNRSGIASLTFMFDLPVNVTGASGLRLFNHTTATAIDLSDVNLSGNGTSSVTWDLMDLNLRDGRYTAELPASEVTTTTGGPLEFTHTFAFHILKGDVSGDTFVNFDDTVPLSLNFGQQGTAYMSGDADGDGAVNFNDTVPQSQNFGKSLHELMYDFGDAQESGTSFPTTLANDGARHVMTGNTLFLGTARDAETDGLLSGDGADEDGVTVDPLIVTADSTVSMTSSAAGFVNGWIDFNQDGDWDDPGEHVVDDLAVISGENTLQISVPADAVPGDTWARFRLTNTAGYGPGGLAPDGEVEDYLLTVSDPVLEFANPITEGNLFTEPVPTTDADEVEDTLLTDSDPVLVFDDLATESNLLNEPVPTADTDVATAPVLFEMRANPSTLFGHSLSLFDSALGERSRRR